jgi:acid phosphatase
VPVKLKSKIDKNGVVIDAAPLTDDGYAVNSIQAQTGPFDPSIKKSENLLPPITDETIGDRLSEKNISWAWYAGGWNQALKGQFGNNFQFHHQPFVYFKKYGPGTEGRKLHLKDEEDLFLAIQKNQLPKVSFFKPVGDENAHPGYSNVDSGDQKIEKLVQAIQKSKAWKKTLIIVTFDEYGGFWDPMAVPKIDRWGLGPRIPAVMISPLVKKGFVDHTNYETVSILSYLEKKYKLKPLSERDQNANPLQNIFAAP